VLFGALAAALCLLWFMNAAMRNERLAAQQTLAEVCKTRLSERTTRFQTDWENGTEPLDAIAAQDAPSAVFAKCVLSGKVDSVLVFDEQGHLTYPNSAFPAKSSSTPLDPRWAEANRAEFLHKDFVAASKLYEALSPNLDGNVAARALQGQIRCLAQSDEKQAAIRLVEKLRSPAFRMATDGQGRLIALNCELMALELIGDRSSSAFQSAATHLESLLRDYDNPALAAPQRRFLMKEVQRLSPDTTFVTLLAEELAAEMLQNHHEIYRDGSLHRTGLPDLWQFGSPNGRIVALFRTATLVEQIREDPGPDRSDSNSEIVPLPPGDDGDRIFVSVPLGKIFPDWRLGLAFKDQTLFDKSTRERTALYLWTGILAVAAMSILTLLAVLMLRRQFALARLKNDLAATISHELKTPLSSMRVLVDTLVESDRLDEKTTREYLQLVAGENVRLSRLVQNFLSFNKMEQNEWQFDFAPWPAEDVAKTAVEAMRGRFEEANCRFDVQIQPDLPRVVADHDALATALINLLDNAYKYSGEQKRITFQAESRNGSVLFSVKDNGIGIGPRDVKKVFRPYYQADRHLTRTGGGVGLGLSIVQHIVTAHNGQARVESRVGVGSAFSITLPVASAMQRGKEPAD